MRDRAQLRTLRTCPRWSAGEAEAGKPTQPCQLRTRASISDQNPTALGVAELLSQFRGILLWHFLDGGSWPLWDERIRS